MTRLRVHSLGISINGYGAGAGQDLANPLGVGGLALHQRHPIVSANAQARRRR